MRADSSPNVAVLTGGEDKPYALGIAMALVDAGVALEFIGSNFVDAPFLHEHPLVVFRNLRGDQSENAPFIKKVTRILQYYARLLIYALRAKPKVFHILWNSKFELFDRTILMVWFRLCGRKIVLTAHNVNKGQRDGTDSFLNRLTLWIQYRLSDAIFVHTEKMSEALQKAFRVPERKVFVIPFPMNNTTPNTDLSGAAARTKLGLHSHERVLLFFGHIAPYKGLDLLVEALSLLHERESYRLVVAGRVKVGSEAHWTDIQQTIDRLQVRDRIIESIEFIPDEETEIYFKAADALVLPYTYIFQSGVLFLGYNYGLPVLAADVGSLKESIVEGETGYVFQPKDSQDLARTIEGYFTSDLYQDLANRRKLIREFASHRYSWSRVASTTERVYAQILGFPMQRPVPIP